MTVDYEKKLLTECRHYILNMLAFLNGILICHSIIVIPSFHAYKTIRKTIEIERTLLILPS